MFGWENWKKQFDAWEDTTARLFEVWMKSPFILEPSGAMLSACMRARAASLKMVAAFWESLGLPTRRDQERTMNMLSRLESRLMDLEERLSETGHERP